jgi:hypothetical protein
VSVDNSGVQETLRLIMSMYGMSAGRAHAMVVAVASNSSLATYAAPTVEAAGFEMGRSSTWARCSATSMTIRLPGADRIRSSADTVH